MSSTLHNKTKSWGRLVSGYPAPFLRFAFSAQLVLLDRMTDFGFIVQAVCALLFAAIVIPHGAIDWWCKQRLLPNVGPLRFFAAYAAAMTATAVLWGLSPALAFGSFLLLSAYHFGLSDTAHLHVSSLPIARAAHGVLVVALITGADQPILTQVFSVLGLEGHAGLMVAASHAAAALSLSVLAFVAFKEPRLRSVLVEDVILVLLFLVASPLLALTLYLALWHSWQHLANMVSAIGPDAPDQLAAKALPYTLGPAILFGVGFMMMDAATAGVLAIVIVGLSILTAPHSLFVTRFLGQMR